MTYSKVLIKRVVSADGKIIAEAKSVANVTGNNASAISQTVSVEISGNICRSSSSSRLVVQ